MIFRPILKYSSSSPDNLGQRDLTEFKYVSMARFNVVNKKRVTLHKYNPFAFISAPDSVLLSNQFWDELRVYATLNYLFIQVMKNHEVGLILVVLAILL